MWATSSTEPSPVFTRGKYSMKRARASRKRYLELHRTTEEPQKHRAILSGIPLCLCGGSVVSVVLRAVLG